MNKRFLPDQDPRVESPDHSSPKDDELIMNERIISALREKLIFDAASTRYGRLDDFNLNTLRGLSLNQALIKYPKLLEIMDDVLVKVTSTIASALSRENTQREVVEDSYDFAVMLKKFGKWFHRNGHYEHALKAFNGALEFLAGDQEIYALMGDIYVQMERYRESIVCYKQASSAAPEDKVLARKLAATHVKMGEMLLAGSSVDQAVKAFTEALGYIDNYIPALCGLGEIASVRGNLHDAEKYFVRVLDTDPSNVRALNGFANVQVLLGEDDDAESLYDEALLNNPVYVPALYDCAGFNFHKRKNHLRAMGYVERILQVDPKNVMALMLKVEIAMETNDFSVAEEAVEKVLELQPTHKEAFKHYLKLKNGDCFLPKKYMSRFRSVSDDRQARSRDQYFSLRYRLDPQDESLFEDYVIEVAKDSGERFSRFRSPYDGRVFLN